MIAALWSLRCKVYFAYPPSAGVAMTEAIAQSPVHAFIAQTVEEHPVVLFM